MSGKYLKNLEARAIHFNKEQKKNIHYQSTKNFILAHENFKDHIIEEKVKVILEDYFTLLEQEDYLISKGEAGSLYYSHILKMGQYYKYHLNFKVNMGLGANILIGIFIDVFLFLIGVSGRFFYIPIGTIYRITHYYLKIRWHSKRGDLYGPRY